ncbi:hypothetical protein [Undibacterium luofuense]|uniref:hypothetical protein n=1 Tax=Undibacterium luofuense TaxID=2828733 RepID=UPI0030EE2178
MLVSLSGITPVPMMGYGASPWLGLALALGLAGSFPSQPTSLNALPPDDHAPKA